MTQLHPFLASPVPLAFAHRGSSGTFPENTLPAFQAAVDLGYHYVETDVHLTGDGILVAFHDDQLNRVSSSGASIDELTFEELSQINVGYTFSADGVTYPYRDKPVYIPRLEELLSTFPHLNINIDPKHDSCILPLAHILKQQHAWDRVCIGSFSDARLTRIRNLSRGKACTSMGPRAVALARIASLAGPISTHGADCIQIPRALHGIPVITPKLIAAAHEIHLPIHIWTVNDVNEMEELLDMGVDGLMTDYPVVLKDVLNNRGLWGKDAPASHATVPQVS